MAWESALGSLIQVAIAIAGFSGIVAAVGRRSTGYWTDSDQLRLRILLTASGATLVFGFLPFVLVELFELSLVWRLASGVYAIYTVGIAIYRARQLSRSGIHPAAIGLRPWSVLVQVAITAMLVANTVWFASFSAYLLCVLWGLVVAFGAFVTLLVEAWRQPPPGPPPAA